MPKKESIRKAGFEMKIKESIWYSEANSISPIGIILTEDNVTGAEKAFIGTGRGFDEGEDVEKIIQFGAKFPAHIAKMLIDGS